MLAVNVAGGSTEIAIDGDCGTMLVSATAGLDGDVADDEAVIVTMLPEGMFEGAVYVMLPPLAV